RAAAHAAPFAADVPHVVSRKPTQPEVASLALHDALPIYNGRVKSEVRGYARVAKSEKAAPETPDETPAEETEDTPSEAVSDLERSEEHTSELQSRFDLVCRLLLEKKKKRNTTQHTASQHE